jgi:hypothetical protein
VLYWIKELALPHDSSLMGVLADIPIATAWVFMCWKMRKINKRAKMDKKTVLIPTQ